MIIDQGQTETVTYRISGGTAPYTYNFMVTNTATGNVIASQVFTGCTLTTNSLTFVLPSSGGYAANALGSLTVTGNVIDSTPFTAGVSNYISANTIASNTAITAVSLTSSRAIIDQGQAETLTYTISGGSSRTRTTSWSRTPRPVTSSQTRSSPDARSPQTPSPSRFRLREDTQRTRWVRLRCMAM